MRTYEALGNTYTRCCATCKHWLKPLALFGEGIEAHVETIRARECLANNRMRTLDLAICSKWQDKDVTE